MYAVAWKCRWKRGSNPAWDIVRDEVDIDSGGYLFVYIDRATAYEYLLVIEFVQEEGEDEVLNPQAVVLGLTADSGAAAKTELPLADRSMILIVSIGLQFRVQVNSAQSN